MSDLGKWASIIAQQGDRSGRTLRPGDISPPLKRTVEEAPADRRPVIPGRFVRKATNLLFELGSAKVPGSDRTFILARALMGTVSEEASRTPHPMGLRYRPLPHDDWGIIRNADDTIFATVRRPLDETEASVHRRDGTDPFEALARATMAGIALQGGVSSVAAKADVAADPVSPEAPVATGETVDEPSAPAGPVFYACDEGGEWKYATLAEAKDHLEVQLGYARKDADPEWDAETEDLAVYECASESDEPREVGRLVAKAVRRDVVDPLAEEGDPATCEYDIVEVGT